MGIRSEIEVRIPSATPVAERSAYVRGEVHPKVLRDLLDALPFGAFADETAPLPPGGPAAPVAPVDPGVLAVAHSGASLVMRSVEVIADKLAGTSRTIPGIFPPGSLPLGVVLKVLEDVKGAKALSVGTKRSTDLWGGSVGVAAGTRTDARDYSADFLAESHGRGDDVVLTAESGTFAGGKVQVTAFYLLLLNPADQPVLKTDKQADSQK